MLIPLRRLNVWSPPSPGLCRLLAATLILGSAVLHLLYLAHNCPLDLAPDEAHYWDWSRHLDWSYYSKGPLVAFLIRGGCELAGAWSEQHTGSLAFAVRLPAVLCGTLLLTAFYVLTVQVFGRPALALAVVAAALTVPLVSVGSVLMTIDAPYSCCWGWALVFAHRAIFRGAGWAWLVAGLLVGLGILAKYTMVLFLPSVCLYLLTSPQHRPLLRRPGPWLMVLVAGLCCLPILVWNLQNDWVTFRHVSRLAGVAGQEQAAPSEPTIHWLGPLVYFGGQCALLLVFWFLAWLFAMVAHHPLRERDPGVRYLWWLSAPMFLLFLGFSFKTGGGELNWPVTAYVSGMVLAAAWLARQLQSPVGWYRRWTAVNLALVCVVGATASLFMHASELLHPALTHFVGEPTEQHAFPLRRVDPTCRLRGWHALGAEVDRARNRLAAEGKEPVLVASSWSIPGALGLYCSGRPQAYSVGLALGDRHSQYDLWPGPLNRPEAYKGRTFLLVGGGPSKELRDAFESVGPTTTFTYYENGRPIAAWPLTVCHGFKGLQAPVGGKTY